MLNIGKVSLAQTSETMIGDSGQYEQLEQDSLSKKVIDLFIVFSRFFKIQQNFAFRLWPD